LVQQWQHAPHQAFGLGIQEEAEGSRERDLHGLGGLPRQTIIEDNYRGGRLQGQGEYLRFSRAKITEDLKGRRAEAPGSPDPQPVQDVEIGKVHAGISANRDL